MIQSNPLFEAALRFFQEDEWPVQPAESAPVLFTRFKGQNGEWSCQARVRPKQEQLVFYSYCPVTCPEERRLAMATFLTRANYGMIIGNFELDLADGEVRYKTSIDVEGDRLSTALIRHVVYANVMMMDSYLPGILAIVVGDKSDEEAIAMVEGPRETP